MVSRSRVDTLQYFHLAIQSWPMHARLVAYRGKRIEKKWAWPQVARVTCTGTGWWTHTNTGCLICGWTKWHAHKHLEKQGLLTKDSLLVLAGLMMARYNVYKQSNGIEESACWKRESCPFLDLVHIQKLSVRHPRMSRFWSQAMSKVYKQSGMSIQYVCDIRLKGFQYCLKKSVGVWQRHSFLLTLAFASLTPLRGRSRLWVRWSSSRHSD